jgi:hypothetical protein
MPLPTQMGVDEAPTFWGTSVGVRKEVEVDVDEDVDEMEGGGERLLVEV